MNLWWASSPILFSNCIKSAVLSSLLPLFPFRRCPLPLQPMDKVKHLWRLPQLPNSAPLNFLLFLSILFSSPSVMLEEAPFILNKFYLTIIHCSILSFVHLYTHSSNMYYYCVLDSGNAMVSKTGKIS